MIVNGFINVVITTIEKRFGLTSSETGLIAGGYDIASFILLIPVSYIGGRAKASKPKWVFYFNLIDEWIIFIWSLFWLIWILFFFLFRYVGVGILVLGIGSLLFASPHYLAGPYRGDNQKENVCQRMSFNGSLLLVRIVHYNFILLYDGLLFNII